MKFTYNGQTAYSSADYLMQVDGDLSGLHVTCRTLNVRAGAGTNFDILGTLSRGTEISVRDVLPAGTRLTSSAALATFLRLYRLSLRPSGQADGRQASLLKRRGAFCAYGELCSRQSVYLPRFQFGSAHPRRIPNLRET